MSSFQGVGIEGFHCTEYRNVLCSWGWNRGVSMRSNHFMKLEQRTFTVYRAYVSLPLMTLLVVLSLVCKQRLDFADCREES